MKKALFWVVVIGIVVLGVYYPIVWWITGIALLLVIVLFVWLISGSEEREDERMIDKFGKDYKDAIAKGKLGLTQAYTCKPDEHFTSMAEIEKADPEAATKLKKYILADK